MKVIRNYHRNTFFLYMIQQFTRLFFEEMLPVIYIICMVLHFTLSLELEDILLKIQHKSFFKI